MKETISETKRKNDWKNNLFLMYNSFILLDIRSHLFFYIISTIESLQILYFPFKSIYESLWDDRLKPIIKTLEIFHYIIPYYEKDQYLYRIVFFCFFVFILIFISANFFCYYLITCNKVNVNFSRILAFLNLIFNPLLLIPFGNICLKSVDCINDGSKITLLTCFSGIQIFYFSMSIILIITIFIFSIISSSLIVCNYPENMFNSKIVCSRYDVYFTIKKMILLIIFGFEDLFGKYSLWLIAILSLIINISDYIYIVYKSPYFNQVYQKMMCTLRAIELFYSFIILMCLLIRNRFLGSLTMVILSTISIILFQIFYKKNTVKFYLNTKAKPTEEIITHKILYLLNLFNNSNNLENYSLGRALILMQDKNDELANDSTKLLLDEIAEKLAEETEYLQCKLLFLLN